MFSIGRQYDACIYVIWGIHSEVLGIVCIDVLYKVVKVVYNYTIDMAHFLRCIESVELRPSLGPSLCLTYCRVGGSCRWCWQGRRREGGSCRGGSCPWCWRAAACDCPRPLFSGRAFRAAPDGKNQRRQADQDGPANYHQSWHEVGVKGPLLLSPRLQEERRHVEVPSYIV